MRTLLRLLWLPVLFLGTAVFAVAMIILSHVAPWALWLLLLGVLSYIGWTFTAGNDEWEWP